ncbi:E3 ubiquitin-protein ligase UBR4-like isoform X4 [Varroa destructor]|uniref:UBR-type domain-containing protein n=1 Tax=Varroa destructor TaxID=109461 RepID=A0A7M7JFS7_VARDE|nr:E3 ubiquitin-protein ligase UBR4-like isoform X4 [Varroa destructor]XP_022651483.1 E3 ubiquitin-protein ligase UBR4-like isoform X4 [Varroa destructor]
MQAFPFSAGCNESWSTKNSYRIATSSQRIAFHGVADSLMRAALSLQRLPLVEDVTRLETLLSDEVLVQAARVVVRMALQAHDDDRTLKYCLDIYQTLTGLLRSSSVRQNVHLLTCVALVRSNSADSGALQGHSVPLNCTLIQLLAELFECTLHDGRTWSIEVLEKDITSSFSVEKVQLILELPLCNHLFSCISVGYRKAALLARPSSSPEDDDDDSEPILGAWYEEVLSQDNAGAEFGGEHNDSGDSNSGDSHMQLAARAVHLLDAQLVAGFPNIEKYLARELTAAHMLTLANIVRDLDGGTVAPGQKQFAVAIQRLVHNLFARGVLSRDMQDTLLNTLGINPWKSGGQWPLEITPRCLAVLAQAILLHPDPEGAKIAVWQKAIQALSTRSASQQQLTMSASEVDSQQISGAAQSAEAGFEHASVAAPYGQTADSVSEDLNVEHAQLLLYLFDSIPLMQRKELLLSLVDPICAGDTNNRDASQSFAVPGSGARTSTSARDQESGNNYLRLGRLLHLFEYLVKHLYAAPTWLTDQVTANILGCNDGSSTSSGSVKYFSYKELEENFHMQEGSQRKLKFYTLCEETQPGQFPKLDGFAINFLLSTQSRYERLYKRIIDLLDVAGSDAEQRDKTHCTSYVQLCGAQYVMWGAWRLFLSLPPSLHALENLNSHPLLLCVLLPRLSHRNLSAWVKDGVAKQLENNADPSEALERTLAKFSGTDHEIALLANLITRLEKNSWTGTDLFWLEVVLGKLQHSFNHIGESDDQKREQVSPLLGRVLHLLQLCRRSLHRLVLDEFDCGGFVAAYDVALEIASSRAMDTSVTCVTLAVASCLPEGLSSILNCSWNCTPSDGCHSVDSWRADFASDPLPSESLIAAIAAAHIGALSRTKSLSLAIPLKRVLHFALRFANDLYAMRQQQVAEQASGEPAQGADDSLDKAEHWYVASLVPLLLDATTESQSDFAALSLQDLPGGYENEMHSQVVGHCYRLLTTHIRAIGNMELIFDECIKYLESVTEKSAGRRALAQLAETNDLWAILYKACNVPPYANYGLAVLRFFTNLWKFEEIATKLTNVDNLLKHLNAAKLQTWLYSIVSCEDVLDDTPASNERLLESFVSSVVCAVRHPDLDQLLFDAFASLAERVVPAALSGGAFTAALSGLVCLATCGEPRWHLELAQTCSRWLDSQPSEVGFAAIVHYQAKLVAALKALNTMDSGDRDDASSDEISSEAAYDEDSAESLSDDETTRLCTYTVTARDYMSQHWYHCHTCGMVEGVGVCSVCAKVCHRDHDVTYAKYGSFFCDCGAKSDRSCQAMEKRTLANALASAQVQQTVAAAVPGSVAGSGGGEESQLAAQSSSSVDSLASKGGNSGATDSGRELPQLALALAPFEKELREVLLGPRTVEGVLANVVDKIRPKLKEDAATSPMGSAVRAEKALRQMHEGPLTFETVDDLMQVTIGSQEGAFENVKMNLGGEQQLRQLLQSHHVRRVAMCALSQGAGAGRRQQVAVSHEKGKVTLLQLATLLRQAEAPRRRLTITRLASAPVGFTALSVVANPATPAADDHLAVCGLKDCHVLTFGQNGVLLNRLTVTVGLEGQNYIIKAIWLPGSQTELAVVTHEFVKIFDLAVDAAAPTYHFILASGNVKDVTFVRLDAKDRYMVVMSTNGFVYYQQLCEESLATNGSFYVTNVMQVDHSGMNGSGGTSIYYSHAMQMLFLSFTNSKTLMAPLTTMDGTLGPVSQLQLASKSSSALSNKLAGGQPLVAWSEVPHHPGLVLAMQQFSNNPVVILLRPGTAHVQEIKLPTAKSKISDMVALRHPGNGGELRTNLVVLCEDGSLKVFTANAPETNFWLNLRPSPIIPAKRGTSRRRAKEASTTAAAMQPTNPSLVSSGRPQFPIDYFEHCNPLQEVDFEGNDLLEVYNREQLKTRLCSNSLYVVCTKSGGFKLDVINSDSSMVITGLRIAVGSQDIQRVPPYVELFGRTINLACSRARWFDLPLTRDESLQADKKVTLTFGVSGDPTFVTILDSVKVYGRTKESFGWPEDNEELLTSSTSVPGQQSPLWQQLEDSLQLVEASFSLISNEERSQATHDDSGLRSRALDVALQLLLLPISSPQLQGLIKSLLSALHVSSNECASRKDEALLQHVEDSLNSSPDGEAFFRLTSITRSVAATRADHIANMTQPGFVDLLMSHFWKLLAISPDDPLVAPVTRIGLAHVDATVHNLVDILYAMLGTTDPGSQIVKHLVDLLLYPHAHIGFGARSALVRAVRPKRSPGGGQGGAASGKSQSPASEQLLGDIGPMESDEELLTSIVDLDKKSSALVCNMLSHVRRLEDGITAVPFLQVLLSLVSQPEHVEALVETAIDMGANITVESTKTSHVQFLLLKVCSILLGRKTPARAATAKRLLEANMFDKCFAVLTRLLEHWKTYSPQIENGLLECQRLDLSSVDMLPFFQKTFVRSHAGDVFEDFRQALTEMMLKLACQMKQTLPDQTFASMSHWHGLLCELMMAPQAAFAKKAVRKLLMLLCGSKESYRQVRDLHAFGVHMAAVQERSKQSDYDALIELMEHLKSCVDVASLRVSNWQRFCLANKWILAFLLRVSFSLNEGVAPAILQLLQLAICDNNNNQPQPSGSCQQQSQQQQQQQQNNLSAGAQTSGQKDKETSQLAAQLVAQLNLKVDGPLISKFLVSFLLDSNTTSIRWQAHSLMHHLHSNSAQDRQREIVNMMWSLWPQLPLYGRKASQFVDLLGFFTLNQEGGDERGYGEKMMGVLQKQNGIIEKHPNTAIYNAIQGLVEFDGYYLECEPCLVCNNPETPFASVKLSQIKVDSRFTTSSQIVKLISSQIISRMTLRIGDVKKSKMVKTVNIYYNNRTVQSVVDLRHNKRLWNRAKSCPLVQGQTELKVEFPLPIVACNLMIEFAEFYENPLAAAEPLQCPRCSTPVSATPGVCGNCGEQVFQCHKCRQINYDEKDPFLCNNCGFCRYAKFDFHLYCKQCCAVNPIENEEERKKAVAFMNNQLDIADKSYTVMQSYKPVLESLLARIYEREESEGITHPQQGHVNRSIQQLGQKYGSDCKATFDELSATVQKVLACRKELVEIECARRGVPAPSQSSVSSGRCFGCVSASIELVVTLLRAMTTKPAFANVLCELGLIGELLSCNLRQGSSRLRRDVRHLLVSLTADNPQATELLNGLILEKVQLALRGNSTDLVATVRHEMSLLALSVAKVDSCWEDRLRTVFIIFRLTQQMEFGSHSVLECVTLPCLKIIWEVVSQSRGHIKWGPMDRTLDLDKWIMKDARHGYERWASRIGSVEEQVPASVKQAAFNWKRATRESTGATNKNWLEHMMFNPSSRQAREVACMLTEALSESPWCYSELLDMLTSYLDQVGVAGEHGARFMELYQQLIRDEPWKQYVVIKGLMTKISVLMADEIGKLNKLEETALTADLTQGFALKMLTEVLASLLSVDEIRQYFKGQMLGSVLDGYLCLRRLVVQRTKLVDDTQEKLLALLEQMTTGTENETRAFLELCVETVKKFGADDIRTPVFIFERVCNLIYPEESEAKDFQVSLEKDSQQEDFLQGRMLGNPYSSNEAGIGPLMRDIKNKICADCELVALLEDDNGMELLVCNKIISLDLQVKDVFKKIWCVESNPDDPMRIVYRMRGLLGDATEEFIESLDSKDSMAIDEEQVYKLSDVMATCGGLEVMLDRLNSLDVEKATPLLQVILKLLGLCIKVKKNRRCLVKLRCIPTLLKTLRASLIARQTLIPEQLINLIERVIQEALDQESSVLEDFFTHTGSVDDLQFLLKRASDSPPLLTPLMRIVPSLTLMDDAKMSTLFDHFQPHLDFALFDAQRNVESELAMDGFCVLVQGLDTHPLHHQLRDCFVQRGILQSAIDYLNCNAPPSKSTLLVISDGWKQFVAKPSLKLILRLLSGCCRGHEASQTLLGGTIPIIHRLEQVSSEEHVGSLAENLMEVLREGNSKVKKQVDDARRQTRAEKKKLAMAMRQKQLGELGMRTNEKGQVTKQVGGGSNNLLSQMQALAEEQGLSCIICREGYRFQPQKVLAIYTFTKRCPVEEYEMDPNTYGAPMAPTPRKTLGYSTVTYFNLVHVECHLNAVRVMRGRDEWDSATLQNSNTKCNGLLPLWGPQVSEHAFVTALARHSTYIQEATAQHDVGHVFTVHDLKLLLSRFAFGKSFSKDTGGGGPESNMHLVPYLLHLAVYTLLSTKAVAREQTAMVKFLDMKLPKLHRNFFEQDSPTYQLTLALAIWPPSVWRQNRLAFIRRLVQCGQARSYGMKLNDYSTTLRTMSVYKPYLLMAALVDKLYNDMLLIEKESTLESWTQDLHDYIRHNDQALSDNAKKVCEWFIDLDRRFDRIEVLGEALRLDLSGSFLESALKLQ